MQEKNPRQGIWNKMTDEQALSKPWQKFLNQFEEIETLKPSEWKNVHILAYICKKFRQKFDREFAITIKGTAPSKSPDIFIVKSLYRMLNNPNMKVMKDYVDWIFEHKVSKTPFRKIGFFITSGFVNEFFEFRRKQVDDWTRSTVVPEVFKTVAASLGVTINTYGDLAFLQMSVARNTDTSSKEYILLGNLELMGLNLEKLKKL